jgi:hypothetical protein
MDTLEQPQLEDAVQISIGGFAAPIAQQSQVPSTSNQRAVIREAQIAAWKKALKVEVGMLAGINLALIGALVADRNSSCPGVCSSLTVQSDMP